MNLFQLNQELTLLLDQLEASDGEINEEHLALLDKLETMIAEKVDSCVDYLKALDSADEFLKSKQDEIQDRRDQLEKKKESFENYIRNIASKRTLVGTMYKIGLRKPSVSVEIINEEDIPMEFWKRPKPEPVIMKTEIKEMLKKGLHVNGAVLKEGTPSLLIKLK